MEVINGKVIKSKYYNDRTKLVNIPKIIMQTYKTRELPDKWKPSQIAIKKYLPDFEYHILSDQDIKDFFAKHFPWYLPTLNNFNHPIKMADAIRYAWLYVHGGIYIDADLELLGDPRSHFTHDTLGLYFVKSATTKAVATNAFLASKPGHPFWLDLLKRTMYTPWYAFGRHLDVMYTTGPLALTDVINRNNHDYVIIPDRLFAPCDVCNQDTTYCARNALIRPLEGGSWHDFDSKLYNFCYCNSFTIWSIIIIIVLLIICYFVYRFNNP